MAKVFSDVKELTNNDDVERAFLVHPNALKFKRLSTFSKSWEIIKKNNGVDESLRIHDLRHNVITNLIIGGI